MYDPSVDSWSLLPDAPLVDRCDHTGTWTGQEFVIFGGMLTCGTPQLLADGNAAAYNLERDEWMLLDQDRASNQFSDAPESMSVDLDSHPPVGHRSGSPHTVATCHVAVNTFTLTLRQRGVMSLEPRILAKIDNRLRSELKSRKGSLTARVVWVADRGFSSEQNRRYLQRAGGHYIIGEKLRSDFSEPAAALGRQGRYRRVADNLEVKRGRHR